MTDLPDGCANVATIFAGTENRRTGGRGEMMELKSCPFCGNRNIEKHIATQYDDESGLQPVRTFFSAVCSCCGCRTSSFHEWENVVNAWNRRANDG